MVQLNDLCLYGIQIGKTRKDGVKVYQKMLNGNKYITSLSSKPRKLIKSVVIKADKYIGNSYVKEIDVKRGKSLSHIQIKSDENVVIIENKNEQNLQITEKISKISKKSKNILQRIFNFSNKDVNYSNILTNNADGSSYRIAKLQYPLDKSKRVFINNITAVDANGKKDILINDIKVSV